MRTPDVRYKSRQSGGLGWLTGIFALGFIWIGSGVFLSPPISYVASALGTVLVIVLALYLRQDSETITVAGTHIECEDGGEIETFEMANLRSAAYGRVLFYGAVVVLRWHDGRTREVPVSRATRDFRRALRAAIEAAEPRAIRGDPESIRSLRRAGLL